MDTIKVNPHHISEFPNGITVGGIDLVTRSSATLVVAASDSLHPERADYICDGVDDQVEIQAAIDALPSGGGKVLLMDGTFNVHTCIYINRDNVVLEGYSANIFQTDGSNCGVIETNGSNIKILGLTIDGNKSGNPDEIHAIGLYCDGVARSNVQVSDCYIHHSNGDGIEMGYGDLTDVIISNNVIHDSREHDVHVNGGSRIIITNNHLYNEETLASVVLDTSEWNASKIEDVEVVNNIIHGTAGNGVAVGVGLCGGVIVRPNRTLISDNIIYSCGMNGVYIGDYSDNADIHDNIIRLNERAGIFIESGSTHTVVRGNTVSYNKCLQETNQGAIEVYADYTILDSNKLYNNDKIGIYLRGAPDYCQVINNYIYGCSQNTTNTYSGVQMWIGDDVGSSDHNIIRNNIIFSDGANVQSYGIKIDGDGSVHYTNMVVEANQVWGSGTADFMLNLTSITAPRRIRDNVGYITENSGTATIANGSTSIAVDHGLSRNPHEGDIMVTPTGSLGSASFFYVDTYTSTQFTIHVNTNPGQNVDFAWKAIVL